MNVDEANNAVERGRQIFNAAGRLTADEVAQAYDVPVSAITATPTPAPTPAPCCRCCYAAVERGEADHIPGPVCPYPPCNWHEWNPAAPAPAERYATVRAIVRRVQP